MRILYNSVQVRAKEGCGYVLGDCTVGGQKFRNNFLMLPVVVPVRILYAILDRWAAKRSSTEGR